MQKSPKQAYTAEVKEQAVKRVKASKRLGAVAKEMGLVELTLRNGVKAFDVDTLIGAGAAQVTPEAMALAMREHGIRMRHQRRYQATTGAQHRLPVADHLLAHDFTPSGLHRVWSAGITYLWTDEGGY